MKLSFLRSSAARLYRSGCKGEWRGRVMRAPSGTGASSRNCTILSSVSRYSSPYSLMAGYFTISNWSPRPDDINCWMRPGQSSSCQQVITPSTPPPGARRVRAVDKYHSHVASRCVAESAASASLTKSSTTSMCAPRPVIIVPTPAAVYAPPSVVSQRSDDWLFGLSCV